jgi:hypothetical protein
MNIFKLLVKIFVDNNKATGLRCRLSKHIQDKLEYKHCRVLKSAFAALVI